MNNQSNRTQFLARDSVTEHSAGDNQPRPVADRRPLRRWSVAELIARAFAAPPTERMSHG